MHNQTTCEVKANCRVLRQGCCTCVLTPVLSQETVQAGRVRDQTARLGCATLRSNTRLVCGKCFLLYEARTYRGREEGKSTQTYVEDCGGAEGNEDKLVGVCCVLRRLVDL